MRPLRREKYALTLLNLRSVLPEIDSDSWADAVVDRRDWIADRGVFL